jgi:hypothetical protein
VPRSVWGDPRPGEGVPCRRRRGRGPGLLVGLSSLAAARTDALGGADDLEALTSGYHLAFLVAAILVASAAAIGGLLLRPKEGRDIRVGTRGPTSPSLRRYRE